MYDTSDLRVLMPQTNDSSFFSIRLDIEIRFIYVLYLLYNIQSAMRGGELKCMYPINVWQRRKVNNGDNDGYESC